MVNQDPHGHSTTQTTPAHGAGQLRAWKSSSQLTLHSAPLTEKLYILSQMRYKRISLQGKDKKKNPNLERELEPGLCAHEEALQYLGLGTEFGSLTHGRAAFILHLEIWACTNQRSSNGQKGEDIINLSGIQNGKIAKLIQYFIISLLSVSSPSFCRSCARFNTI